MVGSREPGERDLPSRSAVVDASGGQPLRGELMVVAGTLPAAWWSGPAEPVDASSLRTRGVLFLGAASAAAAAGRLSPVDDDLLAALLSFSRAGRWAAYLRDSPPQSPPPPSSGERAQLLLTLDPAAAFGTPKASFFTY